MQICIVGGGTAGWLAALFLAKGKIKCSVTVIESSQIGIIGAGEGSTGMLTAVVKNDIWPFGCDLDDFIRETKAGLKYGIEHINWSGDGESYFGPLGGSPTVFNYPDGAFHAQNLSDDPTHLISNYGYCKENNILLIEDDDSYALHFDAHKVGNYFKNLVLKEDNCSCIDAKVLDVTLNEKGYIDRLFLDNNQYINADFFIDASGFNRILMNKLGVKYKSYTDNLPVNTALPFLLDYDENTKPVPYTTAHALSSGWMWGIPTQERKGCGYVFDSNFITVDEAHDEIERTLGHEVDPIRILKFETGRLEKLWCKNCLAIGLGAAFAEPLEATSIHSTIVQLNAFAFEFLTNDIESTCNKANINQYNKRMTKMYDDFKDFLVMHYQTGRNDSEFWRYISSGATRTDFVSHILELCKIRSPNYNDFDTYFGSASWPLYCWILAGIGAIDKNLSKVEVTYQLPSGESFLDIMNASRNNYFREKRISGMTQPTYDYWIQSVSNIS